MVPFRRRRGDSKQVTAIWGCPNRGTHCLAEGSARFLVGAAHRAWVGAPWLAHGGRLLAFPEHPWVPATASPRALGQPVPWATEPERREAGVDAAKVTQ